ncbi:tetratricopeptide repeat protein [Oceanobacillus manasiensis]|uniref:tetratricopeptide repeat protein n=1 Tax=Oceanobacillus manasiensis TaxID=586413 RepID=UPI0005AB4DCA|nr:tetratricopeptide repeat protein [Oceanobacillus manasiensis]
MQQQSEKENVILFPKWKDVLEEESVQALKEKRYEEALTKLDQLLSYHVRSHEIIIGKLICLIELNRHTEAQNICEELLTEKDEHYYHYVHIYLTILFQTNQYELLMEQVEYELEMGEIPPQMEEQFQQLYKMSSKMKADLTVERSSTHLSGLTQAVEEENHSEQWRILENLRQMSALPTKNIPQMLTDEKVHPVTKTVIIQWLAESDYDQDVSIHKFGRELTVIPSVLEKLEDITILHQAKSLLEETEQKNPTLFEMLEKLLFRYLYVQYPILPPSEEVFQLAEAIKHVGQEYLGIHMEEDAPQSDKMQQFSNEIKICDSLYLSIIEE